jgi:CPA2 family monovalent cation:H+ antiporter-2
LTIVSRGEFSIILANLAQSGGLLPILQSFAALYVLILAVLGPLLTKESKRIHNTLAGIYNRLKPKPKPVPPSTLDEQEQS